MRVFFPSEHNIQTAARRTATDYEGNVAVGETTLVWEIRTGALRRIKNVDEAKPGELAIAPVREWKKRLNYGEAKPLSPQRLRARSRNVLASYFCRVLRELDPKKEWFNTVDFNEIREAFEKFFEDA